MAQIKKFVPFVPFVPVQGVQICIKRGHSVQVQAGVAGATVFEFSKIERGDIMFFGNLLGVECFFGIAAVIVTLSFIYGGTWSLRCLLVQIAHDVLQVSHSAKQLQLDHERERSGLEFEQQKNELMVEEARQKLLINRQKMIE